MTKTKVNAPNDLITPKQLKRICEYKVEKEKELQEFRLTQSFMTWFNKEVKNIDCNTFLTKSYFTINKSDVPDEFWSYGTDCKEHVFYPILDKYLNNAGWKCEENSGWHITFRPL